MAVGTLLSARAALEATRGTGVTPTRLLYFTEGSHEQKVATIRPIERRASFVEAFRSYAGIERDILRFSGDFTYTDAIWWLNVFLKAVAAGTGAGADKTWTFLPTHTSDDIKSATVQFGYTDNIGATRPAWELQGCLGEELTLRWVKGETVTFDGVLYSAEGATQISAFTGALSDRTTVSATGVTTQSFIDPTTIGTTADTDVLDATFTLGNQWKYLDTLNNTAFAAELLRTMPKTWRYEFTRYYRNDTELDAMIAKTVRKVRVRSLGPVLVGSNYKIDLDLYGVYDGGAYEKSEVDGIGVEKFVLVPQYDTTALTDLQAVVVNDIAAIT